MDFLTQQDDDSDKTDIDFKTFEENFDMVSIGMILSGIYPKKKNKKNSWTYSLLVIIFFILFIGIGYNSCCVALKQGDLRKFSQEMPILLLSQFTLLKIIIFNMNGDKINTLISNINNSYRRAKYQPEWEKKYIKQEIARGKKEPFIWLVIGLSGLLVVWMVPLIQSSKVDLEKNFRAKIVIHDLHLPFVDEYKYEFPVFEMMYIFTSLIFIVAVLSYIGVDGFFIILSTHDEMQLRILYTKVLNLYTDLKKSDTLLLKNRMKNIVLHHLEIVRFHNDVQDLMSMYFANLFFGNSVVLCVSVYQTVELIKTGEVAIGDAVLVAVALFQAYLPCSHGSTISELSLSIGEAAYFSNWYENVDPSTTRSIRILMTRVQKPLQFSAFGVFPLNIESFSSILTTAWSLFNILRSNF